MIPGSLDLFNRISSVSGNVFAYPDNIIGNLKEEISELLNYVENTVCNKSQGISLTSRSFQSGTETSTDGNNQMIKQNHCTENS